MTTSRTVRLLVALAGLFVVLAGTRLTTAYYTSSAVATTGTFATAADSKVVVASCSATGSASEMNFYWSPVTGAARYEVWILATSDSAVAPTLMQTVTVTQPVPDTYKSDNYKYTGSAGVSRWAYIRAFDATGKLISQSNSIEYRKNANTAGTCLTGAGDL